MKNLKNLIEKTADFINALGKVLEDQKVKWYEYHQIFIPLLGLVSTLNETDRKGLQEEIKIWQKDSDIRVEIAEYFADRLDLPQDETEAIILLTIGFYTLTERYIDTMKKIVKGEEGAIKLIHTEQEYGNYLAAAAGGEDQVEAVYLSEKSIKILGRKEMLAIGL